MRQIDLQRMADDAPFTRFHWTVLIWCALAIVFDGYDLAVVGIALPSIMKDMGVDATQAGFMASSALFGMMFGNMIFGNLSDRFGKRMVMCLCIAIFSLFTAAAGLMKDPISFSAMRFIAVPALMLVMCNVFGITGLPRSVFFIEAAMPVMTQSVVVSGIAGADEQYNALGMSFTTILCLIAIPILMLILG